MDAVKNYLDINRQSWNVRTDVHLESAFYNMEGFRKGETSLNDIELNLLGDVKGKTILHLQCHFGQDSISLARMGASVTGVDLSDRAIEQARSIAAEMNADVQFICCDLYDLPNHLDRQFDLVFTSYGTITWLPDLDRWAKVINRFLRPGGQFIFVEFHPVVWMFDNDFEKIQYAYFNAAAIVEEEAGTYADNEANIVQEYVTWNHGLSEVMGSLLNNGLRIGVFEEFDYSPYNCFKKTIEIAPKQFRIEHLENKIPMTYSIKALKVEG